MNEDILETEWAIRKQLKFIEDYCDLNRPTDETLVSLRNLIREHLEMEGGRE